MFEASLNICIQKWSGLLTSVTERFQLFSFRIMRGFFSWSSATSSQHFAGFGERISFVRPSLEYQQPLFLLSLYDDNR